jgi:pectate lyase
MESSLMKRLNLPLFHQNRKITRALQLSTLAVLGAISGCAGGAEGETPAGIGGLVGTTGGATLGGASSTGGVVSNGGSNANGGSVATTTGGTSVITAGSSSGGVNAGGAATTGGAATGGGTLSTGGTSNGSGGAIGGGTTAGGSATTGGTTTGGGTTATGGAKTGGSTGSGGANTGGTSAAGAATTGGSGGVGGAVSGVVGQPVGFATENGGTVGGKGGQVVTAKTFAELKQYASASQAYIILISGTITNGAAGGQIKITSNKSLVGVGSTAFLQGVGLEVASSNNVIIQNLKITLVGTTTPASVNGGDAIAINGTSKNVWIDHCELYSEDPTVQTDIDKYDGLIDIRDQTGFVTVSWCYLHDHHKTSLVGAADTDIYADRKITYHHNYFKKVIKRAPAEYRGAVGHFFNNYIVGTSTTEASFLLVNTCVRVEKSVYETVKYAVYTVASGTKGNAEMIDNIATQSREFPPACTADIPYEYKSVLTNTTSDVKTVVPAGAGVGKL